MDNNAIKDAIKLTPEELISINDLLPIINEKVNIGYKNAISRNDFPYDLMNDPALLESFKRAVRDFEMSTLKIRNNKMDELSMQQIDDFCLILVSIGNDASKNPLLNSLLGKNAEECYQIIMGKRIDKYGIPELYSVNRHTQQQSTGGCFIATAVFGDYDHPQVIKLRDFRDNKLSNSILGRWFIKKYYILSPSIAQKMINRPGIRNITRMFLNRFIDLIK